MVQGDSKVPLAADASLPVSCFVVLALFLLWHHLRGCVPNLLGVKALLLPFRGCLSAKEQSVTPCPCVGSQSD